MHQNQQLIQYDKISSIFFLSIDFFFIIIISTADFFLIWSDQTKFRQHSLLSSISYRSIFQQLIFFDQTKIPSAFFFIIDSYRSIFSTADFFWSNENSASTPFYHRLIQIKFWFFSAEIIPRKQHYMKIFDDFHIEEYFHLFFFMNWILNFISFNFINELNKWSILIIYLFMK